MITLVTGASSGIGRAIALELARGGHSLILTGRSEQALREVSLEAQKSGAPQVLHTIADLSNSEGVDRLWNFAISCGMRVTGLVLCAGQGWVGPFQRMPEALIGSLVHLLFTGPMVLTQRAVAHWGRGLAFRVLVVSSTAAYQAGPGANVYYGSKAALHRWAVALQHEWRGSPNTLTLACPGAVRTLFSPRAGKKDLRWARTPEFVARVIVRAWRSGARRVVPGWENRLLLACSRFLPEKTMAAVVARSQVEDKN